VIVEVANGPVTSEADTILRIVQEITSVTLHVDAGNSGVVQFGQVFVE
jgi:glutamate dehydrogenase/leucine dehydrogenase